MTSDEALSHLGTALIRDSEGKFRFACVKALVSIKLLGNPGCQRFAAKDRVAFRLDQNALTIERLDTGMPWRRFTWEQIDTLTAGEPETDSGSLFQG